MKFAGPLGIALWIGLCLFTWEGDAWKSKWMLTAVSCGALVAASIRTKFGTFSSLFLGWMITSACRTLFRLDPSLEQFPNQTITAMQTTVGTSLVCLLLIVAVGTKYRSTWDVWLERAFAASSMLGSAWIVGQYILGARGQGLLGPLDQSSMSGCFVVMGFPFWVKIADPIGYGRAMPYVWLGAMLVLLSIEPQASTPLGAAAVCFVAWLVSSRRWRLFDLVTVIVPALTAATLLGLWLNPTLFNDSYRVQFWKFFMTWWAKNVDVWTGTGFSTFLLYGPMIQLTYKYNTEEGLWVWLHSCWLQLIFELGAVGFVLGIVVFLEAIRRAYKQGRHELVAAIATFGAVMAVQYPWRLAPLAVMGSLLGMMALRRGSDA